MKAVRIRDFNMDFGRMRLTDAGKTPYRVARQRSEAL
jgi:hypothetical protein